MKKRIENLTVFLSIIFMIISANLLYIQVINREQLLKNPNNPRIQENFEYRGTILDRKGEIIAVSRKTGDKVKRVYNDGALLSPIIGYTQIRLGSEGLEKALNGNLAGKRFPENMDEAMAFINGKKLTGQDVFLTIDNKIQKIATEAISGYKGAAVIINPSTGEILAIVSKPNFDPNLIETSWDKLRRDKDSPLINRAIDGRYPPGSTFKVFTLATALQLGYVTESTTYQCTGAYNIGTYTVHEALGGKHVNVNIADSLIHSCNIAFAQMGLAIGATNFCDYAKNFKLLENFEINSIMVKPAQFPSAGELSEGGLAQSAFGQGEIAISPLHLAIIISSVANEGKIMKPYIVKGIRSRNGENTFMTHPEVWCQPISREIADEIKNIMVEAVEKGTGYSAGIAGIKVAGKTGTAENPHGETHAWFTGFAPAEKPRYLIVLILENAGFGGRTAAPVAGRILKECFTLETKQ